jgi:hypothetical protein
MKDTFDAPGQASSAADASSRLSAQAMDDTADFLKTLRSGFAEVSRGHDSLTIEDLQAEAKFGSTRELRAAASIAANHYNDLAGIGYQLYPDDKPEDLTLSKYDIDYAIDMADHNIKDIVSVQAGKDVLQAAVYGLPGLGASTIGIATIAYEGLAGGAALLPPLGLAVAGIGGIGAAAYYGYESFQEGQRVKKFADDDWAMLHSWTRTADHPS